MDPATLVGPDGEPALLWLQSVAACVTGLKLFFDSARADVREAVQNAHGLLEALPAVVAMQVHKADVAALNFDEAVRLRGLLRQQCYLGEKLGACLPEQVAGQVSLLIESVCCSGGMLAQLNGAILCHWQSDAQPVLDFLDKTCVRKFMTGLPEVVSDPKTRAHWVAFDLDNWDNIIDKLVRIAKKCGSNVLIKQLSFLSKYCAAVHRCACVQQWHDDGVGSQDKTALRHDSAKALHDLQQACAKLDDFVQGTCAAAHLHDLTAAIMHGDASIIADHPPIFDDLNFGGLLHRVREVSQALISDTTGTWSSTLHRLAQEIQRNLVDWADHGEELLVPSRASLARELVQNEGYQKLTPLATTVTEMVTVAQSFSTLLPGEAVSKAHETAISALKCVSVTFTLFHLLVAWPKIKGHKNQSAEREKLLAQHAHSAFKQSWSCLPEALKKAVTNFGA